MFNEYHQKPATGSSPTHHQHHQPMLGFQQPGDMMGYALPPVPDHMDHNHMHHHHHHHHHQQQQQHQLQDVDMHRHHHVATIQDQIQDGGRQIQMAEDLFQMPVTSTAQVQQPTDIVACTNGQKQHCNIKLEMDASNSSLPAGGGGQQSSAAAAAAVGTSHVRHKHESFGFLFKNSYRKKKQNVYIFYHRVCLCYLGLAAEQPAPKKSSSKSKNTDNNGTKKKKTRSVTNHFFINGFFPLCFSSLFKREIIVIHNRHCRCAGPRLRPIS